MYFSIAIASLLVITASLRIASALGINCRGSGVCKITSSEPVDVAESLHQAVFASKKNSSTIFRDHQHITCEQYSSTPDGADLTLAQIRPLFDALLAHNCRICGSVPIHFVDWKSNDPRWGILTINYVKKADCAGNCIPAGDFVGA
ncbi:hypothetical protein MMC22_004305 [Lobaria immixta]|nr:hypothetical protein [Lobaria immixta]